MPWHVTLAKDLKPMKDILIPASPDDQTGLLQDAIDQGAIGPVRVVLTQGRHVSRGLTLRSDVTLQLDEGARLEFVPDYAAYAATEVNVIAEDSNRAMLKAEGAERIRITGRGEIHCQGSTRYTCGEMPGLGVLTPVKERPRVMVLDRCRDVELSGISVFDSPMWTLHFVDCDGLRVRGIRVDNNRRMPNTDGIVLDGCRDVQLSDCVFRTADDGIVLKTSIRSDQNLTGPCQGIDIRDCVIESRSCALKLGTESFSDFRDITFEDCRIEKSNRGLGIFSRDGGTVDGVRFARVELDCSETPDGFWGSGEALTITVLDRRPETRPAGPVRNIRCEAIRGRMEGAINLFAERSGMIGNVSLDDVELTQRPGSLGTGQSYDIRPTPADLIPSEEAMGRANAWRYGPDGRVMGLMDYPGGMPAIFAHEVSGLDVGKVTFSRPTPLPANWNPEEIVSVQAYVSVPGTP